MHKTLNEHLQSPVLTKTTITYPQAKNTDVTCDNTAPHNCPHGAQHSEAKFVHINNSITVL